MRQFKDIVITDDINLIKKLTIERGYELEGTQVLKQYDDAHTIINGITVYHTYDTNINFDGVIINLCKTAYINGYPLKSVYISKSGVKFEINSKPEAYIDISKNGIEIECYNVKHFDSITLEGFDIYNNYFTVLSEFCNIKVNAPIIYNKDIKNESNHKTNRKIGKSK